MKRNEEIQSAKTDGRAEKRFAPSKEDFSKKRFAALKESLLEMKARMPEVLSYTVFGSMARGNPHKESDIDGYLYVDVSDRENQTNSLLEEEEKDGHLYTYLNQEENTKYKMSLAELLVQKSDMELEQVKLGIKVNPISEKILERHIDKLLAAANERVEYEQAYRIWESERPSEITDTTPIADLMQLVAHMRAYSDRMPKYPGTQVSPNSILYGMFHLDVGGGIRQYREKLISMLVDQGEAGEMVWKKIIEGTEEMENYLQSTSKHYPRTLAEAQLVYGKHTDVSGRAQTVPEPESRELHGQ